MSRKIVNIITPYYNPEITAAAHRMHALAESMSKSFRVNVFTLSAPGSQLKNHKVKFEENLTVYYVAAFRYRKSNLFLRAFFEWWYALKLVRLSNKNNADLLIVTIPFMFLLPVVARFSKTKNKIADLRDIVWHYLPSSGLFKKFIKARITSCMHRSLSKFDAVTVTNEAEKRWLLNQTKIPAEKLTVIPNGISLERYNKLSKIKYVAHASHFVITYIGNIGTGQHFINLIESVKEMSDVKVNLIGDGNEWKNIENYLSQHGIQNVYLHKKKKWTNILPYYQTSNLLFASLKEEYDTAIPSKLYEYLATGLPVLYLGNGAATNFLGTFKNTFLVLSFDKRYLEKMIWNIRRSKISRSVTNNQMIGQAFLREKLSIRFAEIASGLLNEKKPSSLFVEDILQSTKL